MDRRYNCLWTRHAQPRGECRGAAAGCGRSRRWRTSPRPLTFRRTPPARSCCRRIASGPGLRALLGS
eukprot:14260376-Heterocapsa_arctica.AAC.1